jgi:two-component system, NtrC family, response regulator AtoC
MKDIYQVIFSNSHKMSEIKSIIDEIAKTDITVLIKGESGIGKELLAKAIHLNSQRKDEPFVKVDCAAIPKGILQSELFGFEKDALTGAYFQKLGKFELLDGGTILLNDIGEMDISIQAKLLQVLQDGMFSRSGEDGDVIVNTRVVATTKDHLEKSMTEGYFREGLFSKINFISINVPPLRDRKEQILPLSQYYFNFYKKKYGKDIPPFSSKVINAFKEYAWPGNIRELENMVKRIVIDGKEDTVLQDISSNRLNDRMNPGSYENLSPSLSAEKKSFNLKEVSKRGAENVEKEVIKSTLGKTHWNRKQTAKLLGISYNALLYKIQKYNLR